MSDCVLTTVRAATAADAGGIARTHIDTWRDTYAGIIPTRILLKMSERAHVAMWSTELARSRGDGAIVVADAAGAGVVGFGSCGLARSAEPPYAGEVFTLYVHPDYQGTGVGKRLLASLFRRLLAKDLRSALIWVLADNPARFFYQAMGGALVAVRTQRLWGTELQESGYGWANLDHAVGADGPCSTA